MWAWPKVVGWVWSGREWTNLLVFHSLQSVVCDDVIEVVNHYVVSSDPPLTPALGKSFETQISIPDEPPDYDNANRVLKVKREASVITHKLRVFPSSSLQPDIAPLPNIAGVSVETPTEGQSPFLLPLPPPLLYPPLLLFLQPKQVVCLRPAQCDMPGGTDTTIVMLPCLSTEATGIATPITTVATPRTASMPVATDQPTGTDTGETSMSAA